MSVLVVGVNHRTAPLDLLERIALDAQSVAKAVSGLVALDLSLIHISEPTRRRGISYAVFCLKKKNEKNHPSND